MELINKGKKLLIISIVTVLALSFIITALISGLYYNAGQIGEANHELIQGIIRFALSCLLFYFVYKGHRWAKIVTLVLFGFSGIAGMIMSFTISMYLLILAIVYIGCFVILLSKPVTAYMDYKRNGDVITPEVQ